MRKTFSGNADLLAVAVIVITAGLGSAINLEQRVTEHARDRIFTKVRLVRFEREIRNAEREIRKIDDKLRTISCPRRWE
jgi:hypothetical protein